MTAPLYDALISYARRDQAVADRLDRTLRHEGYATWIDRRHLQGGQVWERELQGAIDASRALIVLLSPAAVASLNVQAEFNYALDEGKAIIAVIIQPCDVPARLRRAPQVSIITPATPQALPALVMQHLGQLRLPPSRLAAAQREQVVRRGGILGALAVVLALSITLYSVHAAKTPLPPYQIPEAAYESLTSLIAGPDNALWFLLEHSGDTAAVGRVTISGQVTEYRLPGKNSGVEQMIVGPDGNLWLLQSISNEQLTVMTPSGTLVRTISLGQIQLDGYGSLVPGHNGDFWIGSFDGTDTTNVMVYHIESSGSTQVISLAKNAVISGIDVANDGSAWVAYSAGQSDHFATKMLAHISPTGTIIAHITVPLPAHLDYYPWYAPMVMSPDGALWFTEASDDIQPFDLLRYDPTKQAFTHVSASGSGFGATSPDHLAVGPDGRLWGAGTQGITSSGYWIQPLVAWAEQ